MSQMKHWDQQFADVNKLQNELMKVILNSPDPVVLTSTIQDRDEIDASLAQIAIECDHANLGAKKAQMGSKTNAALSWWAKNLANKIKSISSEYVALQNRKMWLRLLQARFSTDSKHESVDLQAKHLVDLAVRKQQLAELEHSLARDIDLARKAQNELKSQYESIGTADENWIASGSFQSRLGVNFEHARDNPSAKALADCFRKIRVPSSHPEAMKWFSGVNAELIKKSDHLAEQCREIAKSMGQDPESANKITTINFKFTMQQVTTLRDQLLDKFNQLAGETIPSSSPRLVQNRSKEAKTLGH